MNIDWNVEGERTVIEDSVFQARLYAMGTLTLLATAVVILFNWLALRPLALIHGNLRNLSKNRLQTPLSLPFYLATEFATLGDSVNLLARTLEERRRAEQALRESEERFRDMAANVPGIVYQFKAGAAGEPSFSYISPAIKEFLGVEAADTVSDPNTLFDIIVHPDDRPGLDASIEESHRTLEPWVWEGRMIRASGETGWFRASSTPREQDDGSVLWTGLVLDITEHQRAQEQLRQAHTTVRNA